MASQKPNQRSRTPSPLASPRKKPLETKLRKSGCIRSSGLSVHFGVQGRMTSNTPKVAHTVTKSNARIRHNQRTHELGLAAAGEIGATSAGVEPINGDSDSR